MRKVVIVAAKSLVSKQYAVFPQICGGCAGAAACPAAAGCVPADAGAAADVSTICAKLMVEIPTARTIKITNWKRLFRFEWRISILRFLDFAREPRPAVESQSVHAAAWFDLS